MKVSVLTPSWNRGVFLPRILKCLVAQNFNAMEWIIVDDGSIDNTQAIVMEMLELTNFPVTYARFDQRVGKCRADNELLDLASGELVIWCDSDDVLNDGAISKLVGYWDQINFAEQSDFIGVVALCSDECGKIQSSGASSMILGDCKWGELSSKFGMRGDMCILINKKAIGGKRFPEYDLVMNESGFWHQFMDKRVVCIPEILKIMKRDTDNRISGSPKMEYCRGKAISIAFADSEKFHLCTILSQFGIASRYHRYSIHGDISFKKRNQIFTGKKTLIYHLAMLSGFLLALRDIMMGRVVKSHLLFEKGKTAKPSVHRNAIAKAIWNQS